MKANKVSHPKRALMNQHLGISINSWAKAIALRLCDEWDGNNEDNKDDIILLRNVLEKSLRKNPAGCKRLIGSTVIEESYFDKI